LASSQTSIATIDSTVTIPAFSESALAQVTAVGPGASIITASLNGLQATQTITVVDKARIQSLYGTSLLETGGHGYVNISLNAQGASATALTISGTDPSVVNVPATTTIPAGSRLVPIPLTGV